MKMIIRFMKDYKKESILAPLFKMLEAMLELLVPLVVAAIIDKGIYTGSRRYIFMMCLVLFALALIGLLFSITAQYFAAKSAVGAASAMRSRLFSHILSFGYREMDDIGSSTLITRMTSDINQVQNGINMVLRLFLRSPFIVFGAMIMAFTIDVRAALIFVVTIPLLSLVVFTVMGVTKPIYKRVQAALDHILNITRENLTGVRVIRAFNREESEKEAFFAGNDRLTALQKLAGMISGLTNPLTLVIINLAIIVLIQTGAVRVNEGSLSQGEVVALYNYLSQILVELIKFANLIVTITKALASVNRVQDIFAIAPEMKEGSLEYSSFYPEKQSGVPAVEFSDVSFCYNEGGEAAVSDITFRVEPGETIGIIGGTGAGKTTLVNLIPRFYDAVSGTVSLFGHDVKEYSFRELRNMVSVVPQKAQLFAGTIRSNLLMGVPEAAEQEIEEALAISQAKEFVDEKDGRLDAYVEQGGRNLSGGQKQRLTLARALLKKAPVLIMDDSASALDFATDARLRQAIKEMKHKPTVFIVAQRASSLMHADKIIVLDDGKIAGMGDHASLLQECDIYREIYETQFKKEA
ncbi:ABC transporter ATP-binding protein [Eubacterium sp. An3]|uniref:ABC transporter ATP-binding protein n=1 Tax=Eubacterium sp. An3 TaxID=1965628 RepID=UPI0007A90528|nr:ABC transporter ATP-binding protein [Eubacterium sp. An3]OUO28278.1 ATP-binding protein [Eubacterium sp. An3]CVI69636.1 Putative multidrug export ATP-binding/permease protein [Eubacteriaceae bacterium CHKCI004]